MGTRRYFHPGSRENRQHNCGTNIWGLPEMGVPENSWFRRFRMENESINR